MASIEKRTRDGRTVWRAHYRTPAGHQRNKTFTRKVDAERFLTSVESSKNTGDYIDPSLARVTVGDWAQTWLDGQNHVKLTTLNRYEGAVRKHILPTWGHVRLSAVSHSDVQVWVTSLSKTQSPASVRKIHRVLSLILDMAVKDGRLTRNVAAGVNLPRPVNHEERYLTHSQVDDLAYACGYPVEVSKHRALDERTNEIYRLVVLFLAYTGVRFGEMAALRVRRLDLTKRRAVIAESVTPVQGHGLVWGTPKSHRRREVPIPRFLVDDLARHIAGKAPEDLVFGGIRGGEALRVSVFRKPFRVAATAIGIPDLHPHELRHTAASLAIASGADVKVVQQMLGHGSATMTLDTYGHLFENRLDEVADAMDLARTTERAQPAVARVLPERLLALDEEDPLTSVSAGQGVFFHGSPDGIRTRATALRGRRARPLHNGAMGGLATAQNPTKACPGAARRVSLGY
ncbi:Site-specific integrase (modular protein) [Aeromicrobium sp. 9AM]|nr:Site-specific integrase (modular protein) [Aeromicrobium sp. 9AM]